MKEKKTLAEWVRSLIGRLAPEMRDTPEPPAMSVVTTLINKAADSEKIPATKTENRREAAGISYVPEGSVDDSKEKRGDNNPEEEDDDESKGDDTPEEKGKGCSYALKRNIVTSLHEIKKFAEENNLASTMVKALLTLLAEMAIGALRGKVSSSILDTLLKVFSYEAAVADAYSRGEKAARNAAIEKEYFPSGDDGLPHLKGMPNRNARVPDIFTVAKG